MPGCSGPYRQNSTPSRYRPGSSGTPWGVTLLPKTVEGAKFNFKSADIWRMPV